MCQNDGVGFFCFPFLSVNREESEAEKGAIFEKSSLVYSDPNSERSDWFWPAYRKNGLSGAFATLSHLPPLAWLAFAFS
jgi:hypothetical protein